MICKLDRVSFRYPARPVNAVTEVSLEVAAGTHVALVGPNGAGKSTVLRLLTGVLRPSDGRVTVLGRRSCDWKRREMARQVAVVSQGVEGVAGISVRDLVSMGRYPYVNPWSPLGSEDRALVDAWLAAVDLVDLADRDAAELSGGELQRARLARALVQEPQLLLLDEPTAHLDLGHEARFMETVNQIIHEQSVTVIAVTHHLNVAARYADRMILLSGGRVLADGAPSHVLAPEWLEAAFGWPIEVLDLGPVGRMAMAGRKDTARGDGTW